ncbi:MAG: GGDEF domain-containing protein [Butyrivibrio sp.]|nr:GGDEF domain-containing protein [Butyrivibrio sp.]
MNLLAIAVADYVGLVLIIAMLVSSRIRRSAPRDEFKIFSIIAILSAVACVVDFLVFYSDGKAGFLMRLINHAGNTYCFIANPVFAVAWCIYTDLKLYSSRARIKRIYKYAALPGAILVVITVLNLFIPLIYVIDSNNVYHRLPLSYAFYLVEAFYMLYSVIILKRYESRYDKVSFFPIFLMLGPIILGSILQIVFYGVSLIWVSCAVGITSIYMAMQNEFSYQDTLTGQYNRAYLDYVLEKYSKNADSKLGGIMVDVDYFKVINDTFGHHVGDEALIDVARVILFSKPDTSILIRFAGDEFIVLMKDASDEELRKIVENIRNELKVFNENECRQYELSLSIGYTLYDYDKDNIDSFFRKMDNNMYEEKKLKHAER